MKKRFARILSLGLAVVMCASTVAYAEAVTESTTEAEAATEAAREVTEDGDTPLVVGYDQFSQKFSPFFATTSYDMDIASLTNPALLTLDRAGEIVYNGIEGETREYNGTDYTYYGMADLAVEKGDTETVYDIKLREDMRWSDGEPVTADDVIFTYYVLLDNDYDGATTLASTPIKGLQNYQTNSTAGSEVSDEDIAAALEEKPDELKAALTEQVIKPLLASELEWCADALADYGESFGVETAEGLFAALYAMDVEDDFDGFAAGKDADALVDEVAAMYDGDYVTLATNYGDPAYLDEGATGAARQYLVDAKKANGEGEDVASVEGIEKVNDYEVKITTDGFATNTIYQIGVQVAPLHYYGDASLYDYENNSFGFTRGDLSIVREKTTEPMGCGPYKFVKYDNRIVYMEANDDYFLGAPKIKHIQFKETSESDKIPGVQQGTIDLSQPSGSKNNFDQIKEINGNDDLNGDILTTVRTDFLGYGYVGINADIVKIGEKDSEESKNLRKAIATVLCAYRDVNINTYYGDAATVINYPISSVSWASPQKSDDGYEVAFSTDVNGEPIYTEDMSVEMMYEAAKTAALGYFEAAGYTVEDGKVTAAPEGASMQIECMIPGGGEGDHPTYGILTDTKEALGELGFDLEINDLSDANVLWDSLDANTAEMWCAAWGATADPDMYQVYHSDNVTGKGTGSNHYMLEDADLDQMIMDARTSEDQEYRKGLYKECLNIILDWGVELPIYQRQEATLASTQRVNVDTMVKDQSPYYGWMSEIQNLELN